MSFGDPVILWIALGVLLGLAVVFALDYTRKQRLLAKIGDVSTLNSMSRSVSPRRRLTKSVCFVAAAFLALVALARPQIEGESVWRQRGIDVAVVLDYSKSMLAKDVYPSRFERMTAEAEDLLDNLGADRVTTIVFAGAAIHFPLTHDSFAARLLYAGLEPQDLAPGSDLGEALRLARCLLVPDGSEVCQNRSLRKDWSYCSGDSVQTLTKPGPERDRSRAIVVFTDAEDTEGRAKEEVMAALDAGIEVFVIGVGTGAGELIPIYDDSGNEVGAVEDENGAFVKTSLDQALLRELDEISSKVHVFRITGSAGVQKKLRKALLSLKQGEIEQRVESKPIEVYMWFLFPAFMLVLIESCLSERAKRKRTNQ